MSSPYRLQKVLKEFWAENSAVADGVSTSRVAGRGAAFGTFCQLEHALQRRKNHLLDVLRTFKFPF